MLIGLSANIVGL